MEESTSRAIEEHFKVAHRFLKTARLSLEDGDLRTAVDRAYYAMFHTAQAALKAKGVKTRTHRGVLRQFSQEYVLKGEVDVELGKQLRRAFSLRQLSDYEVHETLDEDQVKEVLEQAERFVGKVRGILS